MENNFKNSKKIIFLIFGIFILFLFIRPIYATSVTVEGYTPLLSNYSNLISNNSYMTVKPTHIVSGEKAKVTITIKSGKNHPLINQHILISSPQKKYNLTIEQPKTPTNKKGITYGYIYSKYNKPMQYLILAIDTTYTEYPIIIKNNVDVSYLPYSGYSKSNIFQSFRSPNFLVILVNLLVFLIELIFLLYLIFIEKIRSDSKFKNFLRFMRDFFILYVISILIVIFDPNIENFIILSLSLILSIIYFLYTLL
jgi:hypothetical protein